MTTLFQAKELSIVRENDFLSLRFFASELLFTVDFDLFLCSSRETCTHNN